MTVSDLKHLQQTRPNQESTMKPDEVQIIPITIEPAVADDTGKLTADDTRQTKRLVAVDQPDGSVQIITEAIPK